MTDIKLQRHLLRKTTELIEEKLHYSTDNKQRPILVVNTPKIANGWRIRVSLSEISTKSTVEIVGNRGNETASKTVLPRDKVL